MEWGCMFKEVGEQVRLSTPSLLLSSAAALPCVGAARSLRPTPSRRKLAIVLAIMQGALPS